MENATRTERTLDLKSDCARCAALCCIVFAFDKSESFAFDKAAGEACRNLTTNGRCSVFENRGALGLKGCVSYECYGAGQRVTQDVFSGRHWRDDPALVSRMGAALSTLRRVHENLMLLKTAGSIPMPDAELVERDALVAQLSPVEGWSERSLEDFPIELVSESVATFLKGLRDYVDPALTARN